MPTDDPDDPGADTAMFRAYVDQPSEPAAPASNRTMIVALAVAIVVLVLLVLVLVAA